MFLLILDIYHNKPILSFVIHTSSSNRPPVLQNRPIEILMDRHVQFQLRAGVVVPPAYPADEVRPESLPVQQRRVRLPQVQLQRFVVGIRLQTDPAYGRGDALVTPDVVLPQVLLGRPHLQADLADRGVIAVDVDGAFGRVLGAVQVGRFRIEVGLAEDFRLLLLNLRYLEFVIGDGRFRDDGIFWFRGVR